MSFFALPTLSEQKFTDYISANYSGSYQVQKSFTASEYILPLILVKAGKFKEIEPGTNVFEGRLAVSVLTQVDDASLNGDPVEIHDATVSAIYPLFADPSAVLSAVNGGATFNLWSLYIESFEQERSDRALVSIIEFIINVQTLAIQ